MNEWNKIYKINRELDEIFIKKYNDKDIFKKNCLVLIVEISELANETKCFKYWSIKKPSKEKVLEEYADCIIMILSFYTYYNLKLDNIINHVSTKCIIDLFSVLFKEASNLINDNKGESIKSIFSNLIYMGKLLKFSDKEIYDACYKKMDVVKNRLESNY